ncbi:MAG: (Fe-S)-binding protein [Deltaproteobacteria bacterium]|nr:MAG: (Fe-S)-binding protein [Deltaproteobacteria bacterium]
MSAHSPKELRTLDYCTWCPRLCHFSCPSALGEASEDASAWGLMTLARTLDRNEMPATQASLERLWSCASCYRCQSFCKHGNDVPTVLATARANAVRAGALPMSLGPLAEQVATRGAAVDDPDGLNRLLARERSVAEKAVVATFFPGCDHASSSEGHTRVRRTLALLGELLGGEVKLAWREDQVCCGGTAKRLGLDDAQRRQELGTDSGTSVNTHPRITDCADLAIRDGWTSLWSVLAAHSSELGDRCGDLSPVTVALHGGCRERRLADTSREEIAVLEATGIQVVTTRAVNDVDECCAGDPVYREARPDASLRAAAAAADSWHGVDGERVTSACRCAAQFTAAGTPVRSLLDVVLERCA